MYASGFRFFMAILKKLNSDTDFHQTTRKLVGDFAHDQKRRQSGSREPVVRKLVESRSRPEKTVGAVCSEAKVIL